MKIKTEQGYEFIEIEDNPSYQDYPEIFDMFKDYFSRYLNAIRVENHGDEHKIYIKFKFVKDEIDSMTWFIQTLKYYRSINIIRDYYDKSGLLLYQEVELKLEYAEGGIDYSKYLVELEYDIKDSKILLSARSL